jgi:hypothetical protein
VHEIPDPPRGLVAQLPLVFTFGAASFGSVETNETNVRLHVEEPDRIAVDYVDLVTRYHFSGGWGRRQADQDGDDPDQPRVANQAAWLASAGSIRDFFRDSTSLYDPSPLIPLRSGIRGRRNHGKFHRKPYFIGFFRL